MELANLVSTPKRRKMPRVFTGLDSIQETWDDGLMILMYHAIEPPSPEYDMQELYVAPGKLRDQLRELKEAGIPLVRSSELDHTSGGRKVWITLDDGFRNVFQNALPIFHEFGVPAISFIVAGRIGGWNDWDYDKKLQRQPLMSRSEILEWVHAGLEIGAHTLTHRSLTKLSLAEARREIFDCKKILEDLVGQPVRHFCYPFGDMNNPIRDLVIEAGYDTATSCLGGFNAPHADKFTLRRLVACH
jgi:peptidoglycan/xylan/chitin deacetylase (PgdA/CDA1 family)